MLSLAAVTQATAVRGHEAAVGRRHAQFLLRSSGPPEQPGMARPVAPLVMSGAAARARIHVVDRQLGVLPTTDLIAKEHKAQAAPVSLRPKPRRVTLSFLILPTGWALVSSSVTAELRGRRRELRTLRALGWARGEIRRRLLKEFALLAAASTLAAVLAAYLYEAVLGRTTPSGRELLAIPAAVVMTIAAAWWPVRQATAAADPMATARLHRPAAWTRRQPWMLGQAIRNLLRTRKRSALRVLVIAVSCGALGQELAMRWAFGGTLVASWLGHTSSWQEDPIDTCVVVTTLVMATIAVAELDWLSAHQRVFERRTLHAIGWSAYSLARLVASEAMLLGLAGGITASVIEVAGGLVIAHQVPAGMIAAVAAVTGTGMLVSLIGAASSAAWSRRGATVRAWT
jgi:putative ABC transport system permease protein